MGSDAFKALADPTRRQILEMLGQDGDMNAGQIAARFQISAPSVSHHLSILKNAGLVVVTRRGQNIVYSLNTTVFQSMVAWFYKVTQGGGTNN